MYVKAIKAAGTVGCASDISKCQQPAKWWGGLRWTGVCPCRGRKGWGDLKLVGVPHRRSHFDNYVIAGFNDISAISYRSVVDERSVKIRRSGVEQVKNPVVDQGPVGLQRRTRHDLEIAVVGDGSRER